MAISQNIKRLLKMDLAAQKEAILLEFRKRTPGYGGEHIVGEAGVEHEHEGEYEYTHVLEQSWEFVSHTGLKTVGAVVNTAPYAVLVEFGYMSATGKHVHAGGHRMIESTLRGGEVRRMYAAMARKALIVSLAAEDYGAKGKIAAAQVLPTTIGRKKDGLSVYFRKGRTWVRGGAGGGVTSASLRKAASKMADALTVMLNQGVAQGMRKRK